MFCSKKFRNIKDATKHLLVDAVKITNAVGIEYVVVGGWCPFLRNANQNIKHEGTRDVDLLFFDADVENSLRAVVGNFLKNGYLISAKHDFQLFKKYRVNDRELVFNIDLLHPLEGTVQGSLFSDHFDLGIYFDDDDEEQKKVKSIALPSSKFIFTKKLFSSFFLDGVEIPLIDHAGLVFSKCKSIRNEKRQRDSFDIYLTLNQPENNETIQVLKRCCSENSTLKDSINDLISFVSQNEAVFNRNVKMYCSLSNAINPALDTVENLKKVV